MHNTLSEMRSGNKLHQNEVGKTLCLPHFIFCCSFGDYTYEFNELQSLFTAVSLSAHLKDISL